MHCILCHFFGFNACITLTCIIVHVIDVFPYDWCQMQILLYWLFYKWRIQAILWRMLFHIIWCLHIKVYCLLKREREREREREKGSAREKKALEFSLYLSLLRWTFLPPFYLFTRLMPKSWKKRQKKQCIWKLHIKFSKGSLCPKFLQLNMHLSHFMMQKDHFLCSRMCWQIKALE